MQAIIRKTKSWDGVEKLFKRSPMAAGVRCFFRLQIQMEKSLLQEWIAAPEKLSAQMNSKLAPQFRSMVKRSASFCSTPRPIRNPLEDEFIRRLSQSIYLSAIGTIILAFILGAILSRTITRPIRELTKATHEMAGGKFGQQVPVRSRDEIGELASSFNKMNDDLARSFNLRKQMTADIAHELRTPLSLIIGHAEAVHDGVLPASKENFEIIREEAERLEQLVNDLRILSLADAGELSVDFQPVEINKLLGDIQSHYMVPFNQKRITLDLEPAPVTSCKRILTRSASRKC